MVGEILLNRDLVGVQEEPQVRPKDNGVEDQEGHLPEQEALLHKGQDLNLRLHPIQLLLSNNQEDLQLHKLMANLVMHLINNRGPLVSLQHQIKPHRVMDKGTAETMVRGLPQPVKACLRLALEMELLLVVVMLKRDIWNNNYRLLEKLCLVVKDGVVTM